MSYPINTPIDFVNTNANDVINFQADGPASALLNKIQNFVTTTSGDMLYRASGVNNYIERLPIGSTGQVLTVSGGLPSWGTSASSTANFTAIVTASVAGIPTSRSGGANSGTWFLLDNTYVTWSTASPGLDPNSVFTTASGLFTAPADGTYEFSALISFDSGLNVNAGSGLPAAPLPTGSACRQAQIYSPSALVQYATSVEPNSPSNNNNTVVEIPRICVVLTSGTTVGIRVRHDRTAANTATIGNPLISLPSQTYFSGRRIA